MLMQMKLAVKEFAPLLNIIRTSTSIQGFNTGYYMKNVVCRDFYTLYTVYVAYIHPRQVWPAKGIHIAASTIRIPQYKGGKKRESKQTHFPMCLGLRNCQ